MLFELLFELLFILLFGFTLLVFCCDGNCCVGFKGLVVPWCCVGLFWINVDRSLLLLFASNNGTFEIFCPENKPGSVDIENNFDKNRNGKPGCWIKDVVDQCTVETKLIGTHGTRGKIDDLFQVTIDDSDIIEDDKLTLARTLNPIPPK